MGRTRDDLLRTVAHVLGRRRDAVSGHFGVRASPGGIGAPADGPEPETVRLTPDRLVREVQSESGGLARPGPCAPFGAVLPRFDVDGAAFTSTGLDRLGLGRP